jgi:pimeloyl-ACP methyl ester carboxylesterase
MPFIENAGVPIHYEIEGNGPPLVLQHGVTDSLQTWYERGYVDALKCANRLILIDARGHGKSGKPHDPAAYATELMVGDVTSVLDHVGVATARYFGYSMGALIGFGIARDTPERAQAFILGGASPQSPIAGGSAYMGPGGDALLKAFHSGAKTVVSMYGECLTPELESRLLANDMEALIAWRRQRMASPGFEGILSSIRAPTLLYAGSSDPTHAQVQACAAHIRGATFVSLPDLGHIEAMCRSDLVLPHVLRFMADISNDH